MDDILPPPYYYQIHRSLGPIPANLLHEVSLILWFLSLGVYNGGSHIWATPLKSKKEDFYGLRYAGAYSKAVNNIKRRADGLGAKFCVKDQGSKKLAWVEVSDADVWGVAQHGMHSVDRGDKLEAKLNKWIGMTLCRDCLVESPGDFIALSKELLIILGGNSCFCF